MDLEKILQKKGVSELKHYIEVTCDGVISSNEAVRALYQLCKLLTKHEDSFEVDSLLEIIVLCCNSVNNLKDKEIDPFLMSIYHFLKFFFKHELFEYVSILCCLVKEHCLDKNIKSDMYGYYVQFLTREILANSREYDGSILQETIFFAVQCETLLLKSDIKALCGRLISYPLLFRHAHINNGHRNHFCMCYIELLRNIDTKKEYTVDIYKSFLNVFHITVTGISHCDNEFPLYVQKSLEKIITMMYDVFKNKKIIGCIDTLSFVLQAIVHDVQNFNKKSAMRLEKLNNKLTEQLRNDGGNDQIFIITCSQIGKNLKILLDYFGKVSERWNEHFPYVQLLQTYEIIESVLSQNTFDIEKCCTKCVLKTDIFNALSISAVCIEFVNTILRQNLRPDNVELHRITIRIIKQCCENILVLKRNGCAKYSAFWKYVGLHTYNIGVALYKLKDYKNSKLYTEVFLQNVVLIEGTARTNICFKDALGATLHLHSSNLQHLQQKKDAMLYLVLTILFSKEYRTKAMWIWILVKSDQQSDDELKAITVNHVLKSQENDLRHIVPQYKYDSKRAEELLIFELHYYAENWLSRIPIISCANELVHLSKNIFVKTKAFLLSYDKFLIMFDSKIVADVESTIDLIMSAPKNFSHDICLSLLKFILYQFKFHELIIKNLEDMNNAYIPLKSAPLEPYEEPPNPNDKCDIVPAFVNLKLDCLLKLYEYLDNCVRLWTTILDKKLTDAELLFLRDYRVLRIIKSCAFEFRLHHHQVQMINAWILYYKLADILSDKLAMLEGIGFILEYADCKSSEIIELKQIADGIIAELDTAQQKHVYCLTTFYVNKCAGNFKNYHIVQAYQDLRKAETYLEMTTCNHNICEARILHLKTNFLLIPCVYKYLDHKENVLVTAQAAYLCIAEIYKINSLKCAYSTSILFEISLSNGWLYKHLRLPREVRCYSKESVVLAQKCLLPIRTAQFLSLLAFTDLLDRQYMDCEVKLSGLLKILCATTNNQASNKPIIKVTSCDEDATATTPEINCDASDNNANAFFQTVLHVPTPEPQRLASTESGSPHLRRTPFACPEFLSHYYDCNCYLCRNFEYQKLMFDTVHLEALMHLYQGDREQAEVFFNGGRLLHAKLRLKLESGYPIKLLKSTKFIFPRLHTNIYQNYCVFLLDYSYFLIQKQRFQDATNILNTIIENNKHLKYTNISFWNEVWLQKTNLSIQSITNQTAKKQQQENVLVVVDTIVSTTPENKVSTNPIAVCVVSPGIKTRFKKHVKKIQFDLSESESDQENVAQPKFPETCKYYQLKTPGKTPAPKIKIYTPKSVKQPKRVAPKLTVAAAPTTDSKSRTQTKLVKKTLEQRTKLLTEKLKATQKIPNVDDDDDELVASVEKLTINSRETAKKKYNRIKQPNFSSSSISSIDSPDQSKNKKVLGSRIRKVNPTTSSNTTESPSTRKSTRNRK